jgi:hypothetical protein
MAMRQQKDKKAAIRHFHCVKNQRNDPLARIWAENALSPYWPCKMGRQIGME